MLDLSRYDRIFLLTDEQVAACCLPVFYSTIMHQPSLADQLVLPAGEQHKTLASVQRIWDWLLAQHATRASLLINLGGGVICDLGGFAAATYMRGIDYVNVPTTLLAMVDAASGGKTGFDYGTPLVKNCIGVFAPPVQTIIEPRLLATLPPEQILSGYAEMIKHALLQSPEAFGELLNCDLREVTSPAFGEHIKQSVAFKASIVAQDPNDRGIRQALNFGHTVGHAIEALLLDRSQSSGCRDSVMSGYRNLTQNVNCQLSIVNYSHGYCIMYGLVAEAYLSHMICGLPAETVSTLSRFMLENYGAAPVTCSDYESLLALMQHDKKNREQGTITCTLLRSIGQPVTGQPVTPAQLRESLEYLCSL